MKKLSTVIIIILSILLLLPGNSDAKGKDEEIQEDIASKIIRFHVIANSDSEEDQNLKEKVRDEILKFISPKLKESKSKDESRKLLEEYDDEIPENCVISQSPEAGDEARKGSTIKIVVSKGEEEKSVTVPYVVGKTLTQAKKALEK